jgi:hypothetical protein
MDGWWMLLCNGAGRVWGTSKQPSTMQETAIPGCVLAVGRLRGWFGVGKKNIWVARI